MSSPVDEEIAAYKTKINRHEAEIEQIKAGSGLYHESSNKEKLDLIKSKEDGILACETAIHDLRQGQLGEFFSDVSTRLSSSFETCFWLSVNEPAHLTSLYLTTFSLFSPFPSFPSLCSSCRLR